jgi:hypothetical protein
MGTVKTAGELLCQRERDCYVARRACEMWLARLRPLKLLCIGGGTILPLVAGAAVLGKPQLLGVKYEIVSAVCSLVASILTGLHVALKCEELQGECSRLINVYSSLEAAFQSAQELRFEEVRKNAAAAPPLRFRKRAEQELSNSLAQHA